MNHTFSAALLLVLAAPLAVSRGVFGTVADQAVDAHRPDALVIEQFVRGGQDAVFRTSATV